MLHSSIGQLNIRRFEEKKPQFENVNVICLPWEHQRALHRETRFEDVLALVKVHSEGSSDCCQRRNKSFASQTEISIIIVCV